MYRINTETKYTIQYLLEHLTLKRSAAFSAITTIAELGVPEICVGITEASTTRSRSVPITLGKKELAQHD